MKHLSFPLVLLALALPAPAQQPAPQRHDPSEAGMGQVIYGRYCAACHEGAALPRIPSRADEMIVGIVRPSVIKPDASTAPAPM